MRWDKHAVRIGLEEVGECRPIVLAKLKKLLDSYHGDTKSLAYYDLLAGDWLEHYLHLVYAAWREVLAGNVSTGSQLIPVAADLADQAKQRWQLSGLDSHLRWAVGSLLEGGSPKEWKFERESVVILSGLRERFPVRFLRYFSTKNPHVIVTYPFYKCPNYEWFSALWYWRRWIVWDDIQYQIRITSQIDTAWRKAQSMLLIKPINLSELVQVLMPLHLPVALLEGFIDYRQAVLEFPVARPKIVYSANALHNHLAWKLLVAEWREKGTLLLYHQHGGGYGIDRIHAVEEFETRVSDHFYTFGWCSDKSNIKPLSPPLPKVPRRSRKGILLSCLDMPQVVYRLHFAPMPGTVEVLHFETCKFLSALSDRSNLLIRPYHDDYGWGFVDMMRKAAPDAIFDDLRRSSFIRYAESRLVIQNYLGTGWLETLALDIPTVCFYDPETYDFREIAQPYIEALESVGVVHRSGVSAARFVDGLGNNIESWWKKHEVQVARQNFVKHYANFSPDWKEQWEREFKSLLDEAR